MSVFKPSCSVVFAWLLFVSCGALRAADGKPLAEKDLVALVQLQIGDDAIAGRIQESGLAFPVDDAVLQRLKEAGASEAIVKAVQEARPARPAEPASPPAQAITYPDVLKLLSLGVKEGAILARLAKSPTVFTLDAAQVAALKQAGAAEKLLAAMQGPRALSPQAAEMITDFAIVLDCSGSMREMTKDGEMKMTAAKRVVTDLIQKLPDGLNVTFVIYGHEVFGSADDPRNCKAVKVARPLGPLDTSGRSELGRLIAGLKPTGATPIALSLKTAGAELAKHQSFCGLVLITDGLETCKGDPVAEAAALAANLKLSYGVNVVGFGVKPAENAALKEIADAGKGKYYDADSAQKLTEAIGGIAKELEVAAKPPDKNVSGRRAIKVLKPEIEFPEYAEIQVVSFGIGSSSVDARGKYGEEIRIPSATTKYEIRWVPKTGLGVAILKNFTLAERKVVEIKPEEHLGLIKVNGKGTPKEGVMVYQRGLGSIHRLQECKKFGEIMVVPAEKVNVRVDGEDIEEGLVVKAGTLHELE